MRRVLAVVIDGAELRLHVDDLRVDEMDRIDTLTDGAFYNAQGLAAGVLQQRPKALKAAYVLAKARQGEQVNWSDIKFKLSAVDGKWVDADSGRELAPELEKNPDGTVKTDADGRPVQATDGREDIWTFVDTGERVPFGDVADLGDPTPTTPNSPGPSSE